MMVRGKEDVSNTSAILAGLGTLGADPISRDVNGFGVPVDKR